MLQIDLLQVCRRIYSEGYALPYETYTFDVKLAKCGQQSAEYHLPRRQAGSIRSIHMFAIVEGFVNLVLLQRAFPVLKRLRMTLNEGGTLTERMSIAQSDACQDFFSCNTLKAVEIIHGP